MPCTRKKPTRLGGLFGSVGLYLRPTYEHTLIGNGGREHALGLENKNRVHFTESLHRTAMQATALVGENVIDWCWRLWKIGDFSIDKKIDLLVIGPEVPFVKGLRDYFEGNVQLKHPNCWPRQNGRATGGQQRFFETVHVSDIISTPKPNIFSICVKRIITIRFANSRHPLY